MRVRWASVLTRIGTPARIGQAHVLALQVEAPRVGVHLQERAVLGARRDQRLDVEVVGLAAAEHAAGRVADDVDVRVLGGRHQPAR